MLCHVLLRFILNGNLLLLLLLLVIHLLAQRVVLAFFAAVLLLLDTLQLDLESAALRIDRACGRLVRLLMQ